MKEIRCFTKGQKQGFSTVGSSGFKPMHVTHIRVYVFCETNSRGMP